MSPPTSGQNRRRELRIKLYTGRTKVVQSYGGRPIPPSSDDKKRPGLVQMWPVFLNLDRPSNEAVKEMLDSRQTPRFNGIVPRGLEEVECEVIKAWYDAKQAEQQRDVDAIMGQASANHEENMGAHSSTHERLDSGEEPAEDID